MDWHVVEGGNGRTSERLVSFVRFVHKSTVGTLREQLWSRFARRKGNSRRCRLARSRIEAAWSARLAVKAGLRLDDFLRHRLAVYAMKLPVSLEQLPAQVDIDGGEPILNRRGSIGPAARVALADSGVPRWLRALAEREGANVVGDLRDIEARSILLETRLGAAREREESLRRSFEADVAFGHLVTPAQVEATPEQMGRPVVPSPLVSRVAYAVVVGLVASETWRFESAFLPVGSNAWNELAAQPFEAGATLLASLGAAIAAVSLAWVALSRGREVLSLVPSPTKAVLGSLVATLLAFNLAVAALLPAGWKGIFVSVAVPFVAAAVLDFGRMLAGARASALPVQLAWDRERAVEAVACGRRLNSLSRARAELRALESDRAVARRRRVALERRALAAGAAANAAARVEVLRMVRLTEALVGALELDRFAFVRLNAQKLREVSPVAVRLEDQRLGEHRELGLAPRAP